MTAWNGNDSYKFDRIMRGTVRRQRPSEFRPASPDAGRDSESTSSFLLSLSNRAITRLFSKNQLPVRAASNLSLVRISKGR